MKTFKEVRYLDSDYLISLSKLTDKKIVDVIGYVDQNFDFSVFKCTKIVFEDGLTAYLQGEHDIAFIPQDRDDRMPPNMDEESLDALADE